MNVIRLGAIAFGDQALVLCCEQGPLAEQLRRRYAGAFDSTVSAVLEVRVCPSDGVLFAYDVNVGCRFQDSRLLLTTGSARGWLDPAQRLLEIEVNTRDVAYSAGAVENLLRLAFQYALLTTGKGLLIHAGSVCGERVGILFPGYSGAGKSTLTRLLYEEGQAVLSDDLSLLVLAQGTFTACSSPFFGSEAGLPRTRRQAELAGIYFLDRAGIPGVTSISRGQASARLVTHVPFIDQLGPEVSDAMLALSARLVAAVPAFLYAGPPTAEAARGLLAHVNPLP